MTNLTDKFKLPNGQEITFPELDPNHLREFYGDQASEIFRASAGLLKDLKKENPDGQFVIEFLRKERKDGRDYIFRAADYSTDTRGLVTTIASVKIENELEVSYGVTLAF